MVLLYSTGCPKCKVLEKKLEEKNVKFEKIGDVDLMLAKGFMEVPMLEVDGKLYDFREGVKWVSNYREPVINKINES